MRFKYDRTQNRKSKVFTDVEYELELELPHEAADLDSCVEPEKTRYALYAIVVHSGYSSDGGHYYTYAREPPAQDEEEDGQEDKSSTWYVFNDSKVSYSSFESFKSVSKKLPRDVAYQLFYRKLPPREEEADPLATPEELRIRAEEFQARRMKEAMPKTSKRPLRADLKMAVEKDNLKVMREKERGSAAARGGGVASAAGWKKPDDESGAGGGGAPSCGGGGFNAPGRLVF